MTKTEEVTLSKGEQYKLEVESDYYTFYWKLKAEWFSLFRFARHTDTGRPVSSDREMTVRHCTELYTRPGCIDLRDELVKISQQTHDSMIDLTFREGEYSLRVFKKGDVVETRTGLDGKTSFVLVNKLCGLNLELTELPLRT